MLLSYLHYTVVLIYLFFAGYIAYRSIAAPFNRASIILHMNLALWSLIFVFISLESIDKQYMQIVVDIGVVPNFALCLSIFYLMLTITRKKQIYKSKWLLIFSLGYIISIIVLQLSGKIAVLQHYDKDKGQWFTLFQQNIYTGILHIIYFAIIFYSFLIMFRFWLKRNNNRILRKQVGIILTTGFVSFVLGSANIYVSDNYPDLHIPLFPNLFLIIIAGGTVYAIKKYELYEVTPSEAANNIIETMPDGLLLIDADEKIVTVNNSLLNMLDISYAGIINQSAKKWFSTNFLDKELVEYVFKKQFIKDYKTALYHKKEKISVLFSSCLLQRNKEKMHGIVCIIKDITQLIRTEDELRKLNSTLENRVKERTKELKAAKEKAEESDKLKTAFLQNISHEIRTPMNGITGFAQMLNKPGLSAGQKNKYIEIINTSSKQLLSIVNDIISMSAIEAGQEKVKYSPVGLNQLIHELFALFYPQASIKKIKLQTEVSPDDDKATVITDETKLKQVMTNLIGNALKFTEKGYVKFGYTQKEDTIRFFVEDSGIGIHAKYHKLIFERFRQADISPERKYGGTGLGLSISQAYIELLGSHIQMESEPGKGTIFWFELAFQKKEPAPIAKKQNPSFHFRYQKLSHLTILVVEDDDINFFLYKEIFTSFEINILRATHGEKAVEYCRQRPEIDLVLMDVKLPRGMNGYEATQAIKKIRKELPVVAQTAYAMSDEKQHAINAGCDDYFTKPVTVGKVVQLLEKFNLYDKKTF